MRTFFGLCALGLAIGCADASTAPHSGSGCWVAAKSVTVVNGNQVVTLVARAHYQVCPSKQALDAALGAGTYTVTPG